MAEWLMLFQQLPDDAAIANIAVNKLIPAICCYAFEIVQVPRVSQLIQIENRDGWIPHLLQDKVGPNKSSAAGHKNHILHSNRPRSRQVLGTYTGARRVVDCNKKGRALPTRLAISCW